MRRCIPWGRVHVKETTFAGSKRAEQLSPNVGVPTGLEDAPSMFFGIPNRLANVLVRVAGQVLSRFSTDLRLCLGASCLPTIFNRTPRTETVAAAFFGTFFIMQNQPGFCKGEPLAARGSASAGKGEDARVGQGEGRDERAAMLQAAEMIGCCEEAPP